MASLTAFTAASLSSVGVSDSRLSVCSMVLPPTKVTLFSSLICTILLYKPGHILYSQEVCYIIGGGGPPIGGAMPGGGPAGGIPCGGGGPIPGPCIGGGPIGGPPIGGGIPSAPIVVGIGGALGSWPPSPFCRAIASSM